MMMMMMICNGTMFGDLDWALKASRGFVSISWIIWRSGMCH